MTFDCSIYAFAIAAPVSIACTTSGNASMAGVGLVLAGLSLAAMVVTGWRSVG